MAQKEKEAPWKEDPRATPLPITPSPIVTMAFFSKFKKLYFFNFQTRKLERFSRDRIISLKLTEFTSEKKIMYTSNMAVVTVSLNIVKERSQ